MSIFEFRTNDQADGYCFARVEADNKREALAYAKKEIFVRELSYRETIEIAQRGLPIVDAKTGEVIGGEPEQLTGGSVSAQHVGGNPLGVDAE